MIEHQKMEAELTVRADYLRKKRILEEEIPIEIGRGEDEAEGGD